MTLLINLQRVVWGRAEDAFLRMAVCVCVCIVQVDLIWSDAAKAAFYSLLTSLLSLLLLFTFISSDPNSYLLLFALIWISLNRWVFCENWLSSCSVYFHYNYTSLCVCATAEPRYVSQVELSFDCLEMGSTYWWHGKKSSKNCSKLLKNKA